jgi:AcrR family transcriptional regulator
MTDAVRRDSASTRAAILASAQKAFARAGYDGVGLREIAAGAGVTAMMANRYFGTKEALFAEVMASIMSAPRVLDDALMARPDAAEILARAVVGMTGPEAEPLDAFLIMLHSASSPVALAVARREIERHHQASVAGGLGGADAAVRAGLIMALVSGVQTMRQVVGISTLTEADPEVLARLLTALFSSLLGPRTG